MIYRVLIFVLSFVCVVTTLHASSEQNIPLKPAKVDLKDKASLRRGAKMYMDYCAGCHSLQYGRYARMATDLGIVDDSGEIAKDILYRDYIHTGAKVNDLITNSMPAKDAASWFGVAPPDLSLVARVRGADWLYTYLSSFYRDKSRPLGTNNWLFPDVGMPNVLAELQGEVVPVFKVEKHQVVDDMVEHKVLSELLLLQEGDMRPQQFDSALHDIVNFLVYMAEPVQLKRQAIGYAVIFFLLVLLLFAYLLKKEYWKDIKSRK